MRKVLSLPIIGAIASAVVASICCLGPVVLSILSIGSAGLFSKFEAFRPYFIGLTVILLSLAFYLTYRKKETVCEDGICKIKSAGKWNKIALWIATSLVAFFIAFPFLNLTSQNPPSNKTGGDVVEVTIPVEGMTCSGCEFNIESAIKKLDGIIQVKANYQKADAFVKFEKEKVSIDEIVNAINKAGYKAIKP